MKINNVNNNSIINKKCSGKRTNNSMVTKLPAFKSHNYNVTDKFYLSSAMNMEKILSTHREKIEKFSQVNKDALVRIFNQFKHEFYYSDINLFLQNDNSPDCIKLEALLNRIKDECIFSLYVEPILKIGKQDANSDTDFDKINKFLDFRLNAIKNKSLLNKHNFEATVADVDDIVLRNIPRVNKTLELLGEEAFIFSFKEKKDNVLAFIKDLGGGEWDSNIYKDLIKLTNPKVTDDYNKLETTISSLKSLFPKTNKRENLEQLKKHINTLTRKKYELIENSIKDPKEILEKSLIIAALNNNGLKEDAKKILDAINPQSNINKEYYGTMLNEILFRYYGFESIDDSIIEKLSFQGNKYLPRLFYTKQDFKKEFKNLIQLLIENSSKTNKEIFNQLPKNVQTRLEFEKIGINYDKWVDYNPDLKLEYNIDGNNKIVVSKVDMNDIPKALFLGDEADCCTRVNGSFAKSSISYITSKMIQALEVYHNELPIANTMCYFAKINDRPALILDNIEVKPQYSSDETIKKAIFDYAKLLVKEFGHPDMPIMLSNNRNDIQTRNFHPFYYDAELIGSTLDDSIYLDFKIQSIPVQNYTRNISDIELIPLTSQGPVGRNKSKKVVSENSVSFNDNRENIYLAGVINYANNLDEYFESRAELFERNIDYRYD